MGNIVECRISCWDKKAKEEAELMGIELKDGENDIWLPFIFDMGKVFAVKQEDQDSSNSVIYIEDHGFVIDMSYVKAIELFKKAHG